MIEIIENLDTFDNVNTIYLLLIMILIFSFFISENKVYTELTLSTLAFDRFAINEDTEVTFQLRDFKSFIALADYMKLAMTIHFQGPQE